MSDEETAHLEELEERLRTVEGHLERLTETLASAGSVIAALPPLPHTSHV
jgi:hypothetical protein